MPQITNERVGEYLKTALEVLKQHNGSYPSREVMVELEKKIDLTEYEKSVYEKSGYVRWQSILHFYSINLVKAGWLKKYKGIWHLTEEGDKALKLSAVQLFQKARDKYTEWARSRDLFQPDKHEDAVGALVTPKSYEQSQSSAHEEIKEYIKQLNPYDFQDLVAALFRGMGYYTPFISPRGRDGGIDIVAYKDPIGAELPRIRIQVKHRPESPVTRADVANLNHVLQREGYIGVIVATGGFSPDAKRELTSGANKHMEGIDLDSFIDLWEKYYVRMNDEDKSRLPLKNVYFLAPEE